MTTRYDACIVGLGAAGLISAAKLAELGLKLAVVERRPCVADGPSTRNEGWLHRGTYHATSIKDPAVAAQVAARCIHGYEYVRAIAPQAIEEIGVPTFALVRDPQRLVEVEARWADIGVRYRPITKSALVSNLPELRVDAIERAFRVEDVSINTRVLYFRLLAYLRQLGVDILMDAEFEYLGDMTATVRRASDRLRTIEAGLFVYTLGFGAGAFFRSQFGLDLPLRFWKSHLLITKRLTRCGVFYVDRGEATVMHHGPTSVIGRNEDVIEVERPETSVEPEESAALDSALRRLLHLPTHYESEPVACIKVDLTPTSQAARSLNIAFDEPIKGHICAFPGKMTEAPALADMLARHVFDRLNSETVALRPCDSWVRHRSAAPAVALRPPPMEIFASTWEAPSSSLPNEKEPQVALSGSVIEGRDAPARR